MAPTVLGFLAAGVVAVWLMVRFSLASPALMLEKQGIKKAMGRSVKLVRGSWWRVFGIQLLATIIANVVASIIVIPFAFLAATLGGDGVGSFLEGTGDLGWTFLVVSGIGSVIGSMITFPITGRRRRPALHRPAHPPRGPRPRTGPCRRPSGHRRSRHHPGELTRR